MKLKIPKLERVVFKEVNNKNAIKQLIAQEKLISLNNTRSGKNYLIIEDGIEIFITNKAIHSPFDQEYVLIANKIPTIQNLTSLILKWHKHPLDKPYSVEDVIDSWKDNFFYKEEDEKTCSPGLRQPQVGALHMIMGHLRLPLETGTIVLPTGTGKTETMLSALVANQCQKLLVTVPSDSLRHQIGNKFSTLGYLKNFKIVSDIALYPIVGIIRQGFSSVEELKDFFHKCNVIVTTMDIVAGCPENFQKEIAAMCSNIFIDEAHHVKASTWSRFKNQFPAGKVMQFTATPFRNDGQRLDGKIIFNFPLKNAQEQGYFKKIDFITIREYDTEKADKKIAEVAVERLRKDIADGYNHILMARCGTKERADKVYKLYEVHSDLNPVFIYSNSPGYKESYEKILSKSAKIIVCVDMLGEGFDLPELKVAAFHDIRKSLPVTLQFAGRFTRTKFDEQLGNASFVANIAEISVRSELADLYAVDADWNQILSDTSFGKVKNEEEFSNLMAGFSKLSNSIIPFQNIKPKMSAVVFKNKTNTWRPENFSAGFSGYDKLEYKFYDINRKENLLIIITARKTDVDWINTKDIYLINWDVTLVYWETKNNLLFINSSDNNGLYIDLAKAILDDDAELIKGIDVFKVFYDIKRTKLQNVGLKYFLGKNERFRMSVGSDVAEALSLAERQKGEKAFVMGAGYENGTPTNIGASYKGRIWNKLAGDILHFKNWCIHVGNKLSDPSVDPNQVLKETLIPEQVSIIPNLYPVWIDWDLDMYLNAENKFKFNIDGFVSDLSNTEMCLENPSMGGALKFSINTQAKKAVFEIKLFENSTDPSNVFSDYNITQIGSTKAKVLIGGKPAIDATKFFEEYVPTIWFADGSALTGNDFVKIKPMGHFPKTEIIVWDWVGVDLKAESQGVNPKITNSIQFKVIQELSKTDVDIIYDDDYSGEIADVVTIKLNDDKIKITLYHLKFALEGRVSDQIKNFYEVCGQAQKSVHWKHKEGSEFINHLLKRENKKFKNASCSRLERGTINDLEKLLKIAKKEIPVEFEIYIVQPGASQSTITNDILTLLGVTENFIREIGGINLKVITSA